MHVKATETSAFAAVTLVREAKKKIVLFINCLNMSDIQHYLRPTKKVKRSKEREKTEMCRYVLEGLPCPFMNCKFAHSHQDLKPTLYSDFCDNLEDAALFRCFPCLTFVSTGGW